MIKDQVPGVLLLDKPSGLTSFGVVDRVRRWSRIKKVGHTGTLDPFATGLLVLCLGKATRLAHYITAWDKEYVGSILLGEDTDTDDATGQVILKRDVGGLTREDVERVLEAFRGEIKQLPPRFSAKKLRGVPSYKRARRGEQVDLQPVKVQIHELELQEVKIPLVRFRVRCSKGTYMRSLARDLGKVLGCGGHLAELRRVAVGHLRVEDALQWEEVRSLRGEALMARVWPLERVLSQWEKVLLSSPWARKARHGQDLPQEAFSGQLECDHKEGERVVLMDEVGSFLGIGLIMGEAAGAYIHPEQIWSGN